MGARSDGWWCAQRAARPASCSPGRTATAQATAVGDQFAGRVGLFLRVDDFDATCQRMVAAGVHFVSQPRSEPYGRVAVFLDLEGNRWDLLGPDPRAIP